MLKFFDTISDWLHGLLLAIVGFIFVVGVFVISLWFVWFSLGVLYLLYLIATKP